MKSLSRVIAVIRSFTPTTPELSCNDIAQKTGLPTSTIYRILRHLTEIGLLEKNHETGKFSIGFEVFARGCLYLLTSTLLRTAEPVVNTLSDLSDETVNIIVRDKEYVFEIMKEEVHHSTYSQQQVGSVWPAYASAVGKALLSELTDKEIDILFPDERLQPITEHTVSNKTALKLELEQIRKTGVSFNKEGLFDRSEGIGSIIRDATGMAIAGMTITAPVTKVEQIGRDKLATLVKLGANLISYQFGYKGSISAVRNVQELRSWWEEQIDLTPDKVMLNTAVNNVC